MIKRARIGVIGRGWWATYAHLPALMSYPRAEVTAIADSSPERLARAAEHFEGSEPLGPLSGRPLKDIPLRADGSVAYAV